MVSSRLETFIRTEQGEGKGRGTDGRYSYPAIDRPLRMVMGMTAPLNPSTRATLTTSGTTARRSVSSPKEYVRLYKRFYSEFIF